MAGMTNLIRAFLALVVAFAAFVIALVAVFVPMLISDMHYAPHDGQGGMGGSFLGLPTGILAAVVAGVSFYVRSKRRNLFSNPN